MADLSVTKSFSPNTTILSSEMNINFTDIETYVNNRNTGSVAWDEVKSTAKITIAATTNQLILGTTNTTTLNSVAPSASRVYSIRDAGSDSDVALLIGGVTAAVTELAINNTAADGDPVLSWELSGTNIFTMGVDDGDSDVLKLGTTAIGTSTMWQATAAGEITQPLQPSFQAYVNSSITNVTGDGTTYTVIFDTEVFDQGGDFNLGTSVFTAPVTGRYLVTAAISLGQVATSTHTACNLDVVTSNRTFRHRMTAVPSLVVNWPTKFAAIVEMDASDTFTIAVTVDGGSKVVDVGGGTPFQSHLSCSLIN